MSDLRLEPCPLCGEIPRFYSRLSSLNMGDWFARVSCNGPGLISHVSSIDAEEASQEEAEKKVAERWNAWADRARERFGDTALLSRIARLEVLVRRHCAEVPDW